MTTSPPASSDIGPGGEAIAAPSQASVESGRPPSASRSIAWSMGGQLATTLASLVSTVVLARILTPTDFGAFAFAATVYSVVQWLLQAGMGNYILREADLPQAKIDGALAINSLQGVGASLIVLAAAPIAGWFSHYATIGWVTAAVAVVPLLNSPESISDALWLRHGRYARTAALQVAKAALQSLVAIACQLAFGWGVYALVAGLLAASLTSFGAAAWSLAREYRARPVLDRAVAGALKGFGGRTFVITLAQVLSLRVPDLLLARLVGVGPLGQYSRATSTIDMFSRTTSAAVVRATAPRFYARVHEGTPLDQALTRYADTLMFFVWPSLAGIAVLAAPVIHLVFGPQWSVAGRALPWLCLATAIDAARTGYSEVLMVRDRLGLAAGIEFAHGAYAIALVVLLAPFGLEAVLWGKVTESIVTTALYLVVMRRLGAYRARTWPALFGRNALLAAAAGAPAAALMAAWGWPVSLDVGRFALAIGSGVAAWGLVLLATGHPYLTKALAIVRARLPRGASRAWQR